MTHHLSPNKLLSETDLFLPILKGLSSNIVSVGIKQNVVLIPAPFQNHLSELEGRDDGDHDAHETDVEPIPVGQAGIGLSL